MNVEKIISQDLPTLIAEDTVDTALQYMEDWKVSHLAVLDGNKLLGLVEENGLLSFDADITRLKDVPLLDHRVHPHQHVYEVIEIFADFKLTTLPVADGESVYKGEISLQSLVEYFAEMQSVRAEGSIIVLEMNDIDYSLATLARLIEENDAKVLSASITNIDDSRRIQVSLKINKTEITAIVQTLQRFDYVIKAFFDAPTFEDDLRRRYDELMRYLNI
ncbi:MAG: CBS domain-containing protein [Cryomorphaceae bacterium]|nr:CBS domain-containing protein [Cryomorphaceae bacterium]